MCYDSAPSETGKRITTTRPPLTPIHVGFFVSTDPILARYEIVIGLEIHAQLMTKTKLFSPAINHYGDQPNTNVDVIDAGHPGVLPLMNKQVVDFAIRLGLALNSHINRQSVFARKHYFYPDLPKGYQISQYDQPTCLGGSLSISVGSQNKIIGITRAHIEEDAGKNIHVEGGSASYVDYNRAGTPLLEIVTEPHMRSAEEAMEAFKAIRTLVMYLEICDGNMQEGSIRADLNVSVRPKGSAGLGTRTETKNLNSVRYLGQAVEYEARRQILEIEAGRSIKQETRLWDPGRKETRSMRSKEQAHDYRYFPDPDLLPLVIKEETIEAVKASLPELPNQKAERFIQQLGLSSYDAAVLVSEKALANYFEAALSFHNNPKSVANWVINEILRIEDSVTSIEQCVMQPHTLGKLVQLIDTGTITGKMAKQLFEELLKEPQLTPEEIVKKHGWVVQRDVGQLTAIIKRVVSENPDELTKYQQGRKQVFGHFMGQIMVATENKADPKEAAAILRTILDEMPTT